MTRSTVTLVAVSVVMIAMVLWGFFVFRWKVDDRVPLSAAQKTDTGLLLGITYLSLTSGLSSYYDLGVDSGVLVTEVAPDGAASRAGVKVGDVILSYNGVILEEQSPLLGMMRACRVGNAVVLEVLREKTTRTIEFVHEER